MEDTRPTILDFVEQHTQRFAGLAYLREKADGAWRVTTYAQAREQAYRIAAGLMALGVRKGDKVAMLSEGRTMWVLAELGLLYAGAVNVPLSVNLGEGQDLVFRIRHSEARWVFVSGYELPKIRSFIDRCPDVEKVVVFDDTAFEYDALEAGEMRMSEVQRAGDAFLRDHRADFDARCRSITPDDYANISYTSGTMADPKGILLTHRNYTANVAQVASSVEFCENDVMLLIIPLDHCFGHLVGMYAMMHFGGSLAFLPGRNSMARLKGIPAAIREVRPHVMLSVPALARNFRKNIESGIRARGRRYERLFRLALRNAYAYNREYYNRGGLARCWRKPFMRLYDRVFFAPVRASFGGRMKYFIDGGALLDIEMQRFFCAVGIPMFQAYGLTEATPIICMNSEDHALFGSCGRIVRPMDCRICDEDGKDVPPGGKGEIVVRGENVMAGYWKNPEATKAAVVDGWLHTGDVGYICPFAPEYLFVSGRIKGLLISSDGEKYSPEGFEDSLVQGSMYISQVLLHNSQDPYTIALVVPERETLAAYVEGRGMDPASREGKVVMLQRLQSEFDSYRRGGSRHGLFPERWLPSAIVVCEEAFTVSNQMLNPTMKTVRGKVLEHYADRVAYAYTPEGKQLLNEKNIRSI